MARSTLSRLVALPDTNPPERLEKALDWFFFVVAAASAAWLAVLLFEISVRLGWWQIVTSIVFWLLLAYLLLPRLHRILTTLYVPDYFIGRARTSDGLLGDPINVALRGSEKQVHQAMRQSGWTMADDVSLRSSFRIVSSTLLRRSYDEAPVSPLFLFGRMQDFAYQQEVDSSPGKRHHVRFWRCPPGWMLPGGFTVDWVAAGTYDRSVGLSLFTLQVTHKIDANVDEERDHIVKSVGDASPAATVEVLRDFSTGYHARNGGGDAIVTDGDLPIVDLSRVTVPAGSPAEAEGSTATDSRNKRPATTAVGAVLLMVGALLALANALIFIATPEDVVAVNALATISNSLIRTIVVSSGAVLGIIAVCQLLLAWFVFAGNNLARILVLSLTTIELVGQVIAVQAGSLDPLTSASLLSIASGILVLLALSSERTAVYARRPRKQSKRVTPAPSRASAG